MRYFLFINLFFFVSCASPLKGLQRVNDISCPQRFRPVFKSSLYNTQVNILGKHLSGLLLIKTMPDSSIRMVFSNEMGFKFFDFGFAGNGDFTVYYVIKQMNRKAVIRTLQKDFEMIMMRHLHTAEAYIKNSEGLRYFIFPQGKEYNSYITTAGCTELVNIEKSKKRKLKVSAIMRNYIDCVPDTIGISHKNFNFDIGLKRLER